MTAAEAEKVKAALLIESSHLRRTGESTHCLTCDCFFLKALDAVIEMDARAERDLNDAWAEGHNDGADSMIDYQQKEIARLQSEIAELQTPSGYWDDDGETIWKPDGHGFDPVTTIAGLEEMLYQEIVDDGDPITFTPYHALPKEKYVIRWVPDPDDPDMQRVKLERVEE